MKDIDPNADDGSEEGMEQDINPRGIDSLIDPAKGGELVALGQAKAKFKGLETFPAPPAVHNVIMTSDEVTANCPVTNQPDWYTVTIEYTPKDLCIESKTLKLYLQSFRDQGHFCERFAEIIAFDIYKASLCECVTVTVKQKPRGGVAIEATAYVSRATQEITQ